jgi:hypothetical protein
VNISTIINSEITIKLLDAENRREDFSREVCNLKEEKSYLHIDPQVKARELISLVGDELAELIINALRLGLAIYGADSNGKPDHVCDCAGCAFTALSIKAFINYDLVNCQKYAEIAAVAAAANQIFSGIALTGHTTAEWIDKLHREIGKLTNPHERERMELFREFFYGVRESFIEQGCNALTPCPEDKAAGEATARYKREELEIQNEALQGQSKRLLGVVATLADALNVATAFLPHDIRDTAENMLAGLERSGVASFRSCPHCGEPAAAPMPVGEGEERRLCPSCYAQQAADEIRSILGKPDVVAVLNRNVSDALAVSVNLNRLTQLAPVMIAQGIILAGLKEDKAREELAKVRENKTPKPEDIKGEVVTITGEN